jgi:hypothetical protein
VLPDLYDTYIIEDYYFYADGMDKDFDNWYQEIRTTLDGYLLV